MVFFDQNTLAGDWRAQVRATVDKTALRFIAKLLSPSQLPTCSNCRTIFPSCRQ